MVRYKDRRHQDPEAFQLSITSDTLPDPAIAVDSPEGSPHHEPDLNFGELGDLEQEPDIPAETIQEVWDALKDEFYEQIEQLPLSLHRSFALIGEQDKEVETCRAELLPTIRSYVKLRQSQSLPTQDGDTTMSCDSGPRMERADLEAFHVERQRTDTSSEHARDRDESHEPTKDSQQKEEDVDVVMDKVPLQTSPSVFEYSPPLASIVPETPTSRLADPLSQSAPARPQGLRETDASVPKSAPFPPRPKPKTTRELLTRIAFLMGEIIRASEEKVGLASAAYDSVDRHVRVLDAVIKEHESSSALGLRESSLPPGTSGPDMMDSALNPTTTTTATATTADDDDDEPQLGMIGPSGNHGSSLRRSKKRNRGDQRKHDLDGNPTLLRINSLLPTTQELPIDPHEPRYCYCHQVSYGEMIACDNQDCGREWFHLGCVGLSAPPKGKVKWYCRECEEALGRNKRRRIR